MESVPESKMITAETESHGPGEMNELVDLGIKHGMTWYKALDRDRFQIEPFRQGSVYFCGRSSAMKMFTLASQKVFRSGSSRPGGTDGTGDSNGTHRENGVEG